MDETTEDESLEEQPDIRIEVPKEPEVNPAIYTDTINLVSRGFLLATADINGVPFVFKSVNHHEFDRVRLLSGVPVDSPTIPPRFWDLFLSYHVLFVDGQNILLSRSQSVPKLADMFRDLSPAARTRLIRQLSDLNRKASAANLLVEAYATEVYSRWRWAQVHSLDLSSTALTGIEGTEKLGLSYAQLSWRAINYYEDIRSRNEIEWDNAKFIGGCFAGKGIQKVYDRDSNRRKKDQEERFARKDRLIRHVLFGEPLEVKKAILQNATIKVASTVEELADQVERSLKGEKDWHDEMVAEYENKVKEGFTRKQEQLQNIVQNTKERSMSGGSALAGLTQKEVQRLIEEQMNKPRVSSDLAPLVDEQSQEFLRKWGVATSPDDTIPLQSDRKTGKPWRP